MSQTVPTPEQTSGAHAEITAAHPPTRVGGRDRRARARGQILVIFVLSILAVIGISALAVDIAWYWASGLRVQRAADAAALAGAVFLPGDETSGRNAAWSTATANGYANGVGGVVVVPVKDANNERRLDVTVSAPVPTFFMRIFGITQLPVTKTGKAEFTLAVPMGAPDTYYGVGTFISPWSSPWKGVGNDSSGSSDTGSGWSNPTRADAVDNNLYATAGTSGSNQGWKNFGLLSAPDAVPADATIAGIQVRIRGLLQGSGGSSNCRVRAQLSWNGGTNWAPSSLSSAPYVDLSTTESSYVLGSATDLAAWSGHTWVRADLGNGNKLRVRLTWEEGSGCGSSRTVAIDTLEVKTFTEPMDIGVLSPAGTPLASRGFWGVMHGQGTPSIHGDAHMAQYEVRTSVPNVLNPGRDPDAFYDPTTYYNYTIEMPPGSTNGAVWIFDPGFCAVSIGLATGETWSGDYSPSQPFSSFYDLYDTQNTPWDMGDDGDPVASSGNSFRQLDGEDPNLSGWGGSSDCSAATWHNKWWRLASNLSGGTAGRTYRLHTYTSDPADPTDQANTTGWNSFAIWTSATGGSPRVYGSGAMEAYVRLAGGQASNFYLARIDAVHAGKTMIIDLWDPGDTNALAATLRILQPTSTGYTPATFSYTAARGTSNGSASNCDALAQTNVTSVVTNTGGSSRFNGCWLRITVTLASNYAAPKPPGESEAGWWKIEYAMAGAADDFSNDLTTWKVSIKGNPVHLVVP